MNLNQITLPSRDLNRAVKFYQTLGLTLIVDSIPRYARLLCPDGNSTLSLHFQEELPKGSGIVIYFEDKDLDTTVSTLQEKGVEFEHLPVDQTWLWREAKLKDPDGNQLILFYGGENRINPPWRI